MKKNRRNMEDYTVYFQGCRHSIHYEFSGNDILYTPCLVCHRDGSTTGMWLRLIRESDMPELPYSVWNRLTKSPEEGYLAYIINDTGKKSFASNPRFEFIEDKHKKGMWKSPWLRILFGRMGEMGNMNFPTVGVFTEYLRDLSEYPLKNG